MSWRSQTAHAAPSPPPVGRGGGGTHTHCVLFGGCLEGLEAVPKARGTHAPYLRRRGGGGSQGPGPHQRVGVGRGAVNGRGGGGLVGEGALGTWGEDPPGLCRGTRARMPQLVGEGGGGGLGRMGGAEGRTPRRRPQGMRQWGRCPAPGGGGGANGRELSEAVGGVCGGGGAGGHSDQAPRSHGQWAWNGLCNDGPPCGGTTGDDGLGGGGGGVRGPLPPGGPEH